MNDGLHPDMREASRLTRAGRLTEATALLQRLIRSRDVSNGRGPAAVDLVSETIETTGPGLSSEIGQHIGADAHSRAKGKARAYMPEAFRRLLDGSTLTGLEPAGRLAEPPPADPFDASETGQFLAKSFSSAAGSRSYKLYVPSHYSGQPLPLIVMLHGCTQSPDDFATGTRMNLRAEERDCFVVYPAQAASANASKCWNWFRPGDQQRGQGEPALIAGITRQVISDYSIDRERICAAGLSAGAAEAAILAAAYPDLYAAIGVHSGLACGAASDVSSAFAAMRQNRPTASHRSSHRSPREIGSRRVPAIVFHGDQDTTVRPHNGDEVIAQLREAANTELRTTVERGRAAGGRAYSRTLYHDARGQVFFEQWVVHGAGHAWSGGSPAGSYTDPHGPDATREMLRFFLEHPLRP